MVRKSFFYRSLRSAFTMIELIFAIVIIGITMLTIPMMVETNNQGLERGLAQEAIFLASAVLSIDSTKVWDEASAVDTGSADDYVLAKILDVGAPGTMYGRLVVGGLNTNIRKGGLYADRHRQFFDFNRSAGAPDAGLSTPDQNASVLSYTPGVDAAALSATDYKVDYASSVTAKRQYVADGSAGTDVFLITPSAVSNMKMIEITVPVAGGNGQVVLRTYVANIGEPDYAKRSF